MTNSRAASRPARNWIKVLAAYRKPDLKRGLWELLVTAVPFAAFWAAAWAALPIGYGATLLLSIPAALFLVRLFLIQHDCGHGAMFASRAANDWVGRAIGVLTLTPYADWRHAHAMHHASHGNLEKRGFGDIDTLTVREYAALGLWGRLRYRLYRNPVVMLGIGPAFIFLVRNRYPAHPWEAAPWAWTSALGTNVSIAAVAGFMSWLIGWQAFVLVELPVVVIAATLGIWLFYVQHQFEDTTWEHEPHWDRATAALYGSSHYDLPPVLRWLSANIGVHHVHHLSSVIPYYRLQDVLRDHPELRDVRRLTLWQSLKCLRLRLWDEERRQLVSFREAHPVIETAVSAAGAAAAAEEAEAVAA